MSVRSFVAGMIAIGLGLAVVFAQPESRHRYGRPVVTTAAGPQRLAVDATLLFGANRFNQMLRAGIRDPSRLRAYGGLSDLRLFDAGGREVPYLLIYPEAPEPEWAASSVLPLAITERTSGFEADLGALEIVDTVRAEGLPAPFLKRLVLEGSGDRAHWTMLAAEGTLFDLPQERLRQIALPFRAGSYRYLRVTWDDTNSGRLPLPRAVFARRAPVVETAGGPLTAGAGIERRPSEPGRSRYRIKLPAASLPIVALVLEVPFDGLGAGAGHVFRTVTVTESRLTGIDAAGSGQAEAAPSAIGRSTLVRVVRDGVAAADLRIPISPPREAELDLVVDDANNPPLDIRSVSVEFAELPWIYFESPGGSLVARYGDRAAAPPTYDLEAAREGVKLRELPEATWGAVRELTPSALVAAAPAMPDVGAPLDPQVFKFRRALADGGSGLVALPLDVAVLAHSAGPALRFADVRVLDDAGKQVPYLLERREEPLAVDLEPRRVEPKSRQLRSEAGRNRSVYAVQLPYANLPGAQIVLETSARVFRRTVQTGVERPADRHRRDTWFDGTANVYWQHADQNTLAPALVLPVSTRGDTEILIVIDEGDNSPLPISSARLLLPSYRLRFFRPARPLRLVYGRPDLSLPRYDLALLAPQVMGAEAREIAAAAEDSAASAPAPAFISPTMFWAGLSVAVLLMLGIIAKLVRRAD